MKDGLPLLAIYEEKDRVCKRNRNCSDQQKI